MGPYSPERTCRTCLESKDELTSLYTKDDSTGHTLLEKLRDCASMQVAVSVHVPMHSCLQCIRCINEFYHFKQLCERSEKTLEGLRDPLSCEDASAVNIELPAVVIKTEPFDATDGTVGKFEFRSTSNDGSEVKTKIKNDKRKWPCENCGKSFQRVFHLQRHLASHICERPFPCADCGERFKTEESAKKHAKVHFQKDSEVESKPYECETCGKRFVNRRNLRRHSLLHDNKSPDLCETKPSLTDLAQHTPSKCSACGEQEVSLDEHKCLAISDDKVNADERTSEKKQISCGVCGKTFCFPSDLRRHRTTHSLDRQCDGCNKRFDSLDDMLEHRSTAHPDLGSFKSEVSEKEHLSCDVCGKEFRYLSDLSTHRSKHSLDRPFSCGRCPKTFKTKQKLKLHSRDHLMQERQCDGCDELFDLPDDMLEHRSAAHPDLGPFKCKEKILLKCKFCSKSFTTGWGLKEHISDVHSGSLHRCEKCNIFYFTEKQLLVHKEKQNCDQNHMCASCETFFTSRRKLLEHRRLRHPQRMYPCKQCGASFTAPYLLQKHMDKHSHGSKYICETCGKAYKFERSLSVHIKDNHSAVKPVYECKVCGKRYNVYHSYYRHILLHKEEQNEHECAVCKKRLKSKMQLNQHMRCHNKRHGCDVCGKLFNRTKNLAKHKLCHAREAVKPYACKLCSKRFSTAYAVSFHVSTLHNTKKHIKCDVCGMEFYNRFHYRAHYSKHTGIKPYQCDICGTGYSYSQNFIPHRKRCAAQQARGRNGEVEVTPS